MFERSCSRQKQCEWKREGWREEGTEGGRGKRGRKEGWRKGRRKEGREREMEKGKDGLREEPKDHER